MNPSLPIASPIYGCSPEGSRPKPRTVVIGAEAGPDDLTAYCNINSGKKCRRIMTLTGDTKTVRCHDSWGVLPHARPCPAVDGRR